MDHIMIIIRIMTDNLRSRSEVTEGSQLMREDALAECAHRYLADDAEKRSPYDILRRLRDAGPLIRTAGGPWLVLGYDLAKSMLRDPRFSRSRAAADTLPSFLDPGPAAEIWTTKMVSSDGETHRRLRLLVSKAFSPRAVGRWRPIAEARAKEILDEVTPRGSMDAVAEYAYPLPEHVICTLLGVPVADRLLFERWTEAIQDRVVTGIGVDARRAAAADAILQFTDYLSGVVAAHEPDPEGDLLSQLAYAEEEGSRLSRQELVTVAMEVIVGGHDTTANLIANAIYELARRPELFAAARRGEFTADEFIEELLRARSPVQLSLTRVATETVELAGQTVEEGDVVMVSLASVNRDAGVFPDGDTFDPFRGGEKHMAFGHGPHFCLGSNLARLEAQVALDALIQRVSTLRLTESEAALPWRQGSLVVAPARLPVSW
jgi:cytochrome P450